MPSDPVELVVWEVFEIAPGDRGLRTRPASIEEIIQVLEGMGARTWRSVWFEESGGGYAIPVYDALKAGSYLVLPLPTPQEEK